MNRLLVILLIFIANSVRAEDINISDFQTPYFTLQSSFSELLARHPSDIESVTGNFYHFKEYGLYVEGGEITGYEILAPTDANFRGIHVGSDESELHAQYSWLSRNDVFERTGRYDESYKDYDYILAKDYAYGFSGDSDNGKVRWIIFFIKSSKVARIFIYQGGSC